MIPTVDDAALQNALDNSASQMVVAVETLKACLTRASPITRQLQMDGALASLLRTVREAEELENRAKAGTLTALPDERVRLILKLSNHVLLINVDVRFVRLGGGPISGIEGWST